MQFEPIESLHHPTQNESTHSEPTDNSINTNEKRKRKRTVTWFNPPFNSNITTNIGKTFLSLLDKCFPKNNKLSKIINRNTVKVSYSTLPNVNQTISNHNKKILNSNILKNKTDSNEMHCNCRKKGTCPLNGHCLTQCVIYEAIVKTSNPATPTETQSYIGLTENDFKTRYNAHTSSFKLEHKRSATRLSEHIWDLKDKQRPFNIEWKIIAQPHRYDTSQKTCQLCLEEKIQILFRTNHILNKRKELFNTCMHKRKFLLEYGNGEKKNKNKA